jgi:hypothetical protein
MSSDSSDAEDDVKYDYRLNEGQEELDAEDFV